jgi:CubicO group peptidase (beta-lactamase class C family)
MSIKRLMLVSFLAAISSIASAEVDVVSPESVGLSSQRLKNLDALMQSHIDEKKMAGANVLIARKGKIAYFKSFGMADENKPMQKDSLIRIMSMSKPITSTAVMILYEQGKLLLSDPVSKYIPEFKNQKVLEMNPNGKGYKLVPVKREMTIRDLLTHKSGLLYLFVGDFYPEPERHAVLDLYKQAGITDGTCRPDETIGDMVKRLGRLPLFKQPGEVFDYSLSNDVLGYLIEVVSGMRFDEFVTKNIFAPLKMSDSYFYVPAEKQARIAAVFQSDWKGNLTRENDKPIVTGNLALCPFDAYATSGKYLSGGVSVISTAYDYFRFAQMFLNGGELEGTRLLSRKTVELMTATNHIGDSDATFLHDHAWKFGLGFAIEQDRGRDVDSGDVGTFEWAGLYSTRFSIDPKEQKITIFLSQTTPFGMHFGLWDKLLVQSSSAIND